MKLSEKLALPLTMSMFLKEDHLNARMRAERDTAAKAMAKVDAVIAELEAIAKHPDAAAAASQLTVQIDELKACAQMDIPKAA